MSSSEATTKACSICLDGPTSNNMISGNNEESSAASNSSSNVPSESLQLVENLKQEVTRLKCDKLDLLRQNVVCYLLFL